MSDDLHILPGAFGDEPKTVPIVVYEADGTRKVVGTATFSTTETGLDLAGTITDPELTKLVEQNVHEFGVIADPKFEKEK